MDKIKFKINTESIDKTVLEKVVFARSAVESEDKEQINSAIDDFLLIIKDAIANPDKFDLRSVKVVCETLRSLSVPSEVLLEIGVSGLVKEKDQVKQEKKIAIMSRFLDTLLDIDVMDGSNLAIKFLAKKEIPDKIFIFFIKHLVNNGRLTKNLEKYITKEENLDFLRILVAKYPNQLSTIIDTVAPLENYSIKDNAGDILSAVSDLGTITPIIFNEYTKKDLAGRKEFAHQIGDKKASLFKNIPIEEALKNEDKGVIPEIVYLTYKPVGMSFEKMEALLPQVNDRTKDLEEFNFNENGYEFTLNASQKASLKENQTINLKDLRVFKDILSVEKKGEEEDVKKVKSLIVRVAKAGTFNDQEIGEMMSLVNDIDSIVALNRDFETITEENVFNYLNDTQEILNNHIKDAYIESTTIFLRENPDLEETLTKIFNDSGRQSVIVKKLGKAGEEIDWDDLNTQELAKIVSIFFDNSVLKSLKDLLNKNINKFKRENGYSKVLARKNLKAYISKNIGSFFAKASVGICTAEDIPLFERPNHFHINVVEDEQFVRANIQAYVADLDGKYILLLRAFNPNSGFVDKIDVGAFCEQVLEIGKNFQQENNLEGVYITEQGDWHALSNREQVSKYLVNKYHSETNKVPFTMKVTTKEFISNIYKIS